jgi:hypothetical protein
MMDLPPVLENLLSHLLNTHGTIMAWNIYQGDNGIVNVNMAECTVMCPFLPKNVCFQTIFKIQYALRI